MSNGIEQVFSSMRSLNEEVLDENFLKKYKSCPKEVIGTKLYRDVDSLLSKQKNLDRIIIVNDLGVAPARALLYILRNEYGYSGTFTVAESQFIGGVLSYLFKTKLGYGSSKDRCTVNEMGVKTGSRFV